MSRRQKLLAVAIPVFFFCASMVVVPADPSDVRIVMVWSFVLGALTSSVGILAMFMD